MALLICAANNAMLPFLAINNIVASVLSPWAGVKMTGNAREPTLHTKHVLWALKSIVQYWDRLRSEGREEYREVTFVVYEEGVRLGIGNVVATQPPAGLTARSDAVAAVHARGPAEKRDGEKSDGGKLTIISSPVPRGGGIGEGDVGYEPIDLRIDLSFTPPRVATDHAFYATLLDAIIHFGEADKDASIGQGISRVHETEGFVFAVRPTSEGAGEEGVFRVGQAVDACLQIADAMFSKVPPAQRLFAFEASVRLLSTGRIVGKVEMGLPGVVEVDGGDVSKTRR